jgi:hypothetical protein
LTGCRIPLLDGDLTTPFFKSVYLGHPSCQSFTGQALAGEILELFNKCGISTDWLRDALVGGVFDGQYIHLNVMMHLGEQWPIIPEKFASV